MTAVKHNGQGRGRPKGSKSVMRQQWEVLGEAVASQVEGRLIKELDKLNGKEYIEAVSKILQYFKPKLNAQSVKVEAEIRQIRSITFEPSRTPEEAAADLEDLLG